MRFTVSHISHDPWNIKIFIIFSLINTFPRENCLLRISYLSLAANSRNPSICIINGYKTCITFDAKILIRFLLIMSLSNKETFRLFPSPNKRGDFNRNRIDSLGHLKRLRPSLPSKVINVDARCRDVSEILLWFVISLY